MNDLMENVKIIGMVWYYKEDFENIKKIFNDGSSLGENYAEWLEKAEKGYDYLLSKNYFVEKVYISSKTFPKWCNKYGLELNSGARTKFANEIVYKRYKEEKQFNSLCPLFIEHKYKNCIEQIGTGVLISFAQNNFLLTAAHVIDKMEQGDFYIPGQNKLENLVGRYSYLKLPDNKVRKEDKLDIGYFKLDNYLFEKLHDSINTIFLKDISFIDDASQEMFYTVAGYPLFLPSNLLTRQAILNSAFE